MNRPTVRVEDDWVVIGRTLRVTAAVAKELGRDLLLAAGQWPVPGVVPRTWDSNTGDPS